MTVTIRYFAMLREQAGYERETIDLESPGVTCADLYDQLSHRYGFLLDRSIVKVAVNDQFSGWGQALRDGDQVVFIPPVAGG